MKTPAAEYVCVKPSLEYRQVFLHTQEQAKIAFEVRAGLHSIDMNDAFSAATREPTSWQQKFHLNGYTYGTNFQVVGHHESSEYAYSWKLCVQVQKALSPKYGGKPIVTMEEIVARLSRAKVLCSL